MRPLLVAWLMRHGLPGWAAPDYVMLAGLSALIASAIALRLAKRDGVDPFHTVRALMIAYLGALAGGYLFEALRMLPEAVAARSFLPFVHVGRAAYGGLLFAVLGAALYLKRHGQPIGAFLDRASIGTGIAFALVRTGCFLAGCDYGRPTALAIGMRFPPGSLAAVDHYQRGWVTGAAASLPVHPTQLYEAAVGLWGALVASWVLARGRRDGGAFVAWLAVYAIGRFGIEFLRDDGSRGMYLGLSTAQYVSLAVVAVMGMVVGRAASRFQLPDMARAPSQPRTQTRAN